MTSKQLWGAGLFLLLVSATSAHAAIIVADGGSCTLANAITAANTNTAVGGCRAGDDRSGGGDIIELRTDVSLTAVHNSDANECPNGLPPVTSTVRINGNGHIIARAGAVLDRPWFRILDSTAGNLTLQDVTVANGFLEGYPIPCNGAGINGTVALINSTVSGNNVFTGDGGGINGTATLTRSKVLDNTTTQGNGGGISGTARLFNSVVSRNCTGCQPAAVRISQRSLKPSFASVLPKMRNEGGGIAGTMTLVNTTVSDNSAYGGQVGGGGGLAVDGTATIINSTISGNIGSSESGIGGGIHLYRGTAVLVNSTVSGNSAYGTQPTVSGHGGGIFSSGTWASQLGPGGPVTLIHSTVSGNNSTFGPSPDFYANGAGIFGDAVTLVDTIVGTNVSSNSASGECFSSSVTFGGLSLIGDGSCGAASQAQLTGDPMLGPLADYGAATAFQPLLPGSPAIDRIVYTPGTGCGPTDVTDDQRGMARPQPTGGNCDIGAIEFTGFPANAVLDNFNRVDGAVGANWSGADKLASHRIIGNQVRVRNGGPLYWSAGAFGTNQEAYVTLSNIDPNGGEHALLLKVQGSPANYKLGEIEILYDAKAEVVRVETLLPGRSNWTKYQSLPVTFADGDQLGGKVYATGEVEIYRNNVLLMTVTLTSRDRQFFNPLGGRIGVWFDGAPKATFDSFGGGNIR